MQRVVFCQVFAEVIYQVMVSLWVVAPSSA